MSGTQHGPVYTAGQCGRAQDGRLVWPVVRRLEGCTRLLAVAECLTLQAAQAQAAALNGAAEQAHQRVISAQTSHHPEPATT